MKDTIRNITTLLRPTEQKKLLLHTGFDIVISLLDIAFLGALVWIIHFYTGANAMESFLSVLLSKKDALVVIVFFSLLYAVKNLLACYELRQQQLFFYQVATRISRDQLIYYFNSDYNAYTKTDSSVHIHRISQQPVEFCHYVLRGLQQVISQLILVVFTVVAIMLYDAKLFAILLLVLLPPMAVVAFLVKRKMSALRYQTKTASQKSLQHLSEALSGFIESHIYHKKKFFTKRYLQHQQKLNEHLANQQAVQSMPSRIIEIFALLGLTILMLIHNSTTDTTISTLTIGAFMAAAYKIIPGIVKIVAGLGQIKAYECTLSDLRISDKAVERNKMPATNPIQSIAFKNVSFSYSHKPVLTDFNLSMAKGDFIGISGISGRGKTTMVNLLLGFLTPDSGDIIINDHIASPVHLHAYHHRISYTRQQPFFMYDTLMNNIVFEREAYNEQRLKDIVETVGIHTILNNSNKIDRNFISEHGRNISGGQRQRVALARALYKDFDLLILDEPCSELDEPSEAAVLENLQKFAKEGKIILLITHRPNSLSFCTKVISMNES